jgi:Rab GDP dissociation inhibitor
MEGKVCGVTSEGENAKCKKVVCDPSYLQNKVNTLYIQILEGLVILVPNTYILLDDKLIY